jgi:hypothetical protein
VSGAVYLLKVADIFIVDHPWQVLLPVVSSAVVTIDLPSTEISQNEHA